MIQKESFRQELPGVWAPLSFPLSVVVETGQGAFVMFHLVWQVSQWGFSDISRPGSRPSELKDVEASRGLAMVPSCP